jgi:hypothetical protein
MFAASDSGGAAGAGFVLILIVAGLYFIPTIVGAIRHVPNIGSIIVINLFLGWSVIGWIVALAMAARSVPPSPVQQHYYMQQHPPSYPPAPSPPPAPPPAPLPPDPQG